PASVNLSNNQTAQFTATVTNADNTNVLWSISPAGTGTISATGLYTAPALISGTLKVTVTATSVADGSKSASATVNLTTSTDVGSGAPNPTVTIFFQSSFY